ncbi:MAG: hypothetical protein JXJ04_09505 [Spirochaetales bacterium]|nr:hypothetical protein [Spirochaetales bacterium]
MKNKKRALFFLVFIPVICFHQDTDSIGLGQQDNFITEQVVTSIEKKSLSSWFAEGAAIKLETAPVTRELKNLQEDMYKESETIGGVENNSYLSFRINPDPEKKVTVRLRLKKPVLIEGISKTISFWSSASENDIVGIHIIISDIYGIEYKLPVCSRCPPGWMHHDIYIMSQIPQQDFHVTGKSGITFHGFEVFTHPWKKAIFLGIDMVTAHVDTYYLEYQDDDAIQDNW